MTNRPRPRNVEVGASFRLLSSGRGVAEAAPGKTDYCLSVSVSVSVSVSELASVLAGALVGASASLDSPVFSVLPGSTVLSGVLDTAVI